jgi:hypothetical protein
LHELGTNALFEAFLELLLQSHVVFVHLEHVFNLRHFLSISRNHYSGNASFELEHLLHDFGVLRVDLFEFSEKFWGSDMRREVAHGNLLALDLEHFDFADWDSQVLHLKLVDVPLHLDQECFGVQNSRLLLEESIALRLVHHVCLPNNWLQVLVVLVVEGQLVLIVYFFLYISDFLHYLLLPLHQLVVLAAEVLLVENVRVLLVTGDSLRFVEEDDLRVVFSHEGSVFFEALLENEFLSFVVKHDYDVCFESLDGVDDALTLLLGLWAERVDEHAACEHCGEDRAYTPSCVCLLL